MDYSEEIRYVVVKIILGAAVECCSQYNFFALLGVRCPNELYFRQCFSFKSVILFHRIISELNPARFQLHPQSLLFPEPTYPL